MWLLFHTGVQVGKSSHIEIGKDPWRKETLTSRVVLSFRLALSLSCRQTEKALKAVGSIWGKWYHQGKEEKKNNNQKETQTNITLFQNTPFSLQAFSRWQFLKSLSWFLRMQAAIVYIISSYTQAGIKWRLSDSLESFYSGSDSSQTVTSPEGEEKV